MCRRQRPADTDAFCTAYEKLQLDPTNNKVIRKQAAQMAKARPPREVVKALGLIKAAASGNLSPADERAVEATSTLTAYVSDECSTFDGSRSSGSSPSSTSRCPLTEQQVGSAVGAQLVVNQTACTSFPSDAARPNVVFVRQVAFACDGTLPSEVGYTERLDGLGVKAYVQRDTVPTTILVCDKLPFEISVDIAGDSGGSLAAAQQLASLVLKRS